MQNSVAFWYSRHENSEYNDRWLLFNGKFAKTLGNNYSNLMYNMLLISKRGI